MELNKTHMLIGTRRLNLRTPGDQYATQPTSHGARMFYTRPGSSEESPVATLHVATAEESEHGTGALVDLISDDPAWWEQLAAEAMKTAEALRELNAKPA